MHNRDKIKWAPFNSIINGTDVINEIKSERTIKKPILSDEQIEEIERKIKEYYENKTIVYVIFYKNGKLLRVDGIITKIDIINKKIILNQHLQMI